MLVLISRTDSGDRTSEKAVSWLEGDTHRQRDIMDQRLLSTVGLGRREGKVYGLRVMTMREFAEFVPLRDRIIGDGC